MTKKVWTAPTVEELGIDATLGGIVPRASESFFEDGNVNRGGGSVFPRVTQPQ